MSNPLLKKSRLAKAHPLIVDSMQLLILDTKYKMPFYGEFGLFINHQENKKEKTCGIKIDRGNNILFTYNTEFLDSLGTKNGKIDAPLDEISRQKQVSFMYLHNIMHMIYNHPRRANASRLNIPLAHIAQDMVINSIMWTSIPHKIIEIPKYPENETNNQFGITGKNMALFVPLEYEGDFVFEFIYNFLENKYEDYKDRKQKGQVSNDIDYGDFGQDDHNGKTEMFSLDSIFNLMENMDGQFMDSHLTDEVPDNVKEMMVDDIISNLRSRGLTSGNIEETINKLVKKRKDHLKFIKRSISQFIMGRQKVHSITRPNRRQIKGAKGNRKYKTQINVILDTSGSMGGMFDKVLSYIFQDDIEVNIIQIDTEVNSIQTITKKSQLQKITIKGLGGTILQPGVDVVCENFNNNNTVILTDGYTDSLDLSRHNGRVLIITTGAECPISSPPKSSIKQYIINENE